MAELKLKYASDQQYQLDAVDAVVKLFEGQEFRTSQFTAETLFGTNEPAIPGYANNLRVSPEHLLQNLHNVQDDNCLPQSDVLTDGRLRDFTVEMETGTGKTYVYTRTMFELNKAYGLTKFIVVVPSVAIREGVKKSFESTKEHFKMLYDGVPFDPFIYESDKMGKVGNFATSSQLQVMIINIDAFRKDVEDESRSNLFHRLSEKLPGGTSPRELISQCNPIVIIDEPQSVDNTPKAKEAIKTLNPLFVLRYSATHKEPYNMIYRLTPVDAFQQGLVKGIAVDSLTADANFNTAFVQVDSVKVKPPKVKLTLDTKKPDGTIKRKPISGKLGQDLYDLSGENERYQKGQWIITNFGESAGDSFVEFASGKRLLLGQSEGDVDQDDIRRAQIRQTIENHLEKQLTVYDQGIKVLSLFFLDKVANYREDDGSKGKYARMFEEEYGKACAHFSARYEAAGVPLLADAELVHDGYFSRDGHGKPKDTNGNTKADYSQYDLIMKDKETLLSFVQANDSEEEKHKKQVVFIFSHSALREGWDNPNVFQICSLPEIKSDIAKRQKIGRGLRLCVNQDGERLFGADLNQLTVIATESVQAFADGLQKEFEDDGISFGVLVAESFSNIKVEVEGVEQKLGAEQSRVVYAWLSDLELIDNKGRISQELKEKCENDELELPEELAAYKPAIEYRITRLAAKLPVRNKNDEVDVVPNDEAFGLPEFDELWDRIRRRTTYRIEVDSSKLIESAVSAIDDMASIEALRIHRERAGIAVEESGTHADTTLTGIVNVDITYDYPDPIQELQDRVELTRHTIKQILDGTSRYPSDFIKEPRKFLDQAAAQINITKRELLQKGIKYTQLPESEWFKLEIMKPTDAKGYEGDGGNAIKLTHHPEKYIYNYVVFDSTIEESFANKIELDDGIKVFAKLPAKFVVDTPLGPYNPDWAYVSDREGRQTLYFVVETKGKNSDGTPHRTPEEKLKNEFAQKHFEALGIGDLHYEVQTEYVAR